jgi:hypothetical protein
MGDSNRESLPRVPEQASPHCRSVAEMTALGSVALVLILLGAAIGGWFGALCAVLIVAGLVYTLGG